MPATPPTRRKSFSETDRAKGEDAFGKFRITGGPCEVCRSPQQVLNVCYWDLSLPNGIDPAKTIFKDYIGINCGCYAKFHRQVTHIQEAMRRHG